MSISHGVTRTSSGVVEDQGLNFSPPTVVAYATERTPAMIGQQLSAYVSPAPAAFRLAARINTDSPRYETDFPLRSVRPGDERRVSRCRMNRGMIAEALGSAHTPEDQRSRRSTAEPCYISISAAKATPARLAQDLEMARRCSRRVVSIPTSASQRRRQRRTCLLHWVATEVYRRRECAVRRVGELGADLPEVRVAQAWILFSQSKYDEAIAVVRSVIERTPDTDGAYYLLGRCLFTSGRFQDAVDIAESAVKAVGDDYNVYIPLIMSAGHVGKKDLERNLRVRQIEVLQALLKKSPEDGRARSLLADGYAALGRADDAIREAQTAIAMRPKDGIVLYNIACTFCHLGKTEEALDALRKSIASGITVLPLWIRSDPDLQLLHGNPEFEKIIAPYS